MLLSQQMVTNVSIMDKICCSFQQERNTLRNWPLNCDVQSSRAVRVLYRPLASGYRRAHCIVLTSHVELEDVLSAGLRISFTDAPCYASLFTELGNPLLHTSVNHDSCAQCCNSCKTRRCCSVNNETFITSSTITCNVATQYTCKGNTLLFMIVIHSVILHRLMGRLRMLTWDMAGEMGRE